MRVGIDLSMRGVAVQIPRDRLSIEAALAGGTDLADGQAEDETAWKMAAQVAAQVLESTRVPAREVGLLVYSGLRQGEEDWKAAPMIARVVGADRAVALAVRQTSNGGAISMQMAVSHLMAEERTSTALVLTADSLGNDLSLRRQRGIGATLIDAATAVLLSRGEGRLMIRSMASGGRSVQEAALPAGDPLNRSNVIVGRAVEAMNPILRVSIERCVRDTVRAAFADAGLVRGDPRLSKVLLPRIERDALRPILPGALVEFGDAEVLHLPETGHLFAGDLAANLSCLLDDQTLPPCAYALILNIGVGFAVTCLVVQAGPGGQPS
ncbi:MAG: 3-oxoacyl-[acyl-carrier-protein] synthase [Mycobacterium sp.]|nr:3-oxoacyl-[acyl-carrier-protein] synthase [Mycobacterium sp.]